MSFFWSDAIERIKYIGVKTYCPICQSKNAGFSPLSDFYRLNAERNGYVHYGKGEMTALETYSCVECGASDRERLYAYWLQDRFKKQGTLAKKMIHFAPEGGLSAYLLQSQLFSEYETADLVMEGVSHKVDLTKLPFSDNSYDFFICSHVLEHVNDDIAAIRELFRITRIGGGGILMAPIIVGLPRTVEDPSVTDEGERWRLFGQNDHVRLYCHNDYVERVRSQGFRIEQFDKKYFGAWLFRMLGLKPSSILYVVRK